MGNLKHFMLAVLLALISITASAYDFEVDGFYYNVISQDDLNCEVTYKEKTDDYTYSSPYSGDIVIPSTVAYSGKSFSVTKIGNNAFCNCPNLTSVEIPSSVTSIGEDAFGGCFGLTSVDIPDSVTEIEYRAFGNCSSLTSVVIPNFVTSIGNHAFGGCNNLTSVIIGNSVSSIGEAAFSYCSNLASVEIPNSVTSIEKSAFWCCTGLISVEVPNSVTSIGEDAFGRCSSLTSVEIPNSVTSIGSNAFAWCTSLTSFTGKFASEDNRCLIVDGVLNSFAQAGLIKYKIPNSVTSIGDKAFGGCNDLIEVEIPNSVTTIEWGAFSGCTSLASVVIPNSVTSIGNCAFYGCSGLTSVDIPNSVTTIEWGAFSGCTSLASVVIPNSVTSIGYQAFSGCSSLTSVEIGNSVTEIGYSTFSGCSSLTSVEIGNSVTLIGYNAFAWCTSLTSLVIPNSVTEFGLGAFYNCTSLTSVEIGNSVTDILSSTFSGCISLTSFTGKYASEDNRCLIVDGVLNSFARGGLTSYVIPNSVTLIGENAFSGCNSLTSVEIPNSVTEIGCDAFSGCYGLTEVGIPNSVTEIGNYAFAGCLGLISLTIENSNPANIVLCESVFQTVPTSTCVLYVPEGSKELYAVAEQWKDFKNIKEYSIKPEGVSLNKSKLSLLTGEKETLIATILPNATTDKTIVWSSSDENVVMVTETGIVTAVNVGDAIITAECGEISATCTVTVNPDVYTITYYIDGEVYQTETMKIGAAIKPIAEPEKEGQTFSGWSEIPEKMPAHNVTVMGSFTISVDVSDTDVSQYDNVLFFEKENAYTGNTATFSLKMNNKNEITRFQCDIYLPNGMTFEQDEDGFYLTELSTERTTAKKTNIFNSVIQSDGALRILASSTSSATFSGTSGEVATVTVSVSKDMADGDYPLVVKGIELSDNSGTSYSVEYVKSTVTVKSFTLGDVNNDSKVNVADITAIANNILGLPTATFIEGAADLNNDTKVNVADITCLANLILYGDIHGDSSVQTRSSSTGMAEASLPSMSIPQGENIQMPVYISGDVDFSAFQFDITLPDGISLVEATLGDKQTSSDQQFFNYAEQSDGSYRVLGANIDGRNFIGNDGEIVMLTLQTDANAVTGNVSIEQIILSKNGVSCQLAATTSVLTVEGTTSIDSIFFEDGTATICTMQGMIIMANATKDKLSKLQKGVYIVNGKKIVIK